MAHFGSVKAIRAASIEQIREVRGIGAKKAEAVYSAVHASQEKA
ncbi:MAG: helix-hairpin-helix domain-containing protein [Scardovia wiggsiae]